MVGRPRTALALVALVGLAVPASAADSFPPPIHPFKIERGHRVRVWTEAAPAISGEGGIVTGTSATGLMVVVENRPRLVAFSEMQKLELRRPWKFRRRGALLGAALGLGAGFLWGNDSDSHREAINVVAFSAGGALLGTAAAMRFWPARWVPVSLDQLPPGVGPPALTRALPPRSLQPQLAVRLRF